MINFFIQYIPILIVSFLITYLTTPIFKKISLKIGLIDKPGKRKIHLQPIPRFGGLAIYLGCILTVLANYPLNKTLVGILAGSGVIILVGLLDDIFNIKAWQKLLGQILAVLITIHFGIEINFLSNPLGGMFFLGQLALPITIIWLVGIINTINLIDGLDGLASGISAISSFVLFIVALASNQHLVAIITLALLGANIGFLRYNFSPAQIFMGDTGSMFLGYILGVVSIIGVLKSTVTISLAVPILALGIPIFDTSFAIIRRIKKGQHVFKPDNEHLHHKLINLGLSQKQVAICLYLATMALGIIAFIISKSTGVLAIIFLSLAIMGILGLNFLFRKKQSKVLAFLHFLF